MSGERRIRERRMRRLGAWLGAVCVLAGARWARAQGVVLDQVVAVVNNRAILSSDLDDDIRLSILDPNNRGAALPSRELALEQLISRTLIEQQIREEDQQSIVPSAAEVQARLEQIRKTLPVCVRATCASDAGWAKFLAEHDLRAAEVETYLRNRMEILNFIVERFQQGIRIEPEEIEQYYAKTLLPQYPAGETPPPLTEVSQRIEEILLQQQVNALFDDWLKNLREQGDIEVLDPALAPAAMHANAGGGGA